MARRLGQWTSRARQSIDALRSEIGTEYKDVIDPLKEARDDIRGIRREIGESAKSVVGDLDAAAADVRDTVDPKKQRLTAADIAKAQETTQEGASEPAAEPPSVESTEHAADLCLHDRLAPALLGICLLAVGIYPNLLLHLLN